jgi:hypothetical protein
MAAFARRLLSVKVTVALSMALLAGLLVHVSFTRADVTPIPCSSPTGEGPVVLYTGDETDACALVVDGGTVQTKGPTTPSNPIWTKVIIPSGVSGEINIHETDESDSFSSGEVTAQQSPPPGCDPDHEYRCLTSEIFFTGEASQDKPIRLIITTEEEKYPFEPTNEEKVEDLRMTRDGVVIPRCKGGKLGPTQTSCLLRVFAIESSSERLDEDVRFVVLTTTLSGWRPK